MRQRNEDREGGPRTKSKTIRQEGRGGLEFFCQFAQTEIKILGTSPIEDPELESRMCYEMNRLFGSPSSLAAARHDAPCASAGRGTWQEDTSAVWAVGLIGSDFVPLAQFNRGDDVLIGLRHRELEPG